MKRYYELSSPVVRGSKVSWFEIAVAVMMLLVVGVFGGAQAQTVPTCPGPPTSTLTSVDYDPLLPVDTVANFTMNMPAGSSVGRSNRELRVWKQQFGREDEGVSYQFQNLSSNLPYLQNFNASADFQGYFWRGYHISEQTVIYGPLDGLVVPFANMQIRIVKTQPLAAGVRTISFASSGFYAELYDTNICAYYRGAITAAEQSFTLNVASAMALSLTGGSTTGTVDFGNALATDAKRHVDLRLRSNMPYKVTMTSTHNGVLKLNDQASSTEQIAYSSTLNGSPISPNTPITNNTSNGTGGADVTLPFEITIGDTSNARAGFYKDVVTLTVGSPP